MEDSRTDILVSAVLVPERGESRGLEAWIRQAHALLSSRYSDHEIVVIDQGAGADPGTKARILGTVPCVRWLTVGFSQGRGTLLLAGLESAIGDYVVLARPGVDPCEILHDMVEECSLGHDMVVGVADYPKTLGYRAMRRLGDGFLRLLGHRLPKNATPTRCLSRKTVNALLNVDFGRHLIISKLMAMDVSVKGHEYDLTDPRSVPKKTVLMGVGELVGNLIHGSVRPLRLVSVLGVAGSLCSLAFAAYGIAANLVRNDVVEGWTTITFFFSFLVHDPVCSSGFFGRVHGAHLKRGLEQEGFPRGGRGEKLRDGRSGPAQRERVGVRGRRGLERSPL